MTMKHELKKAIGSTEQHKQNVWRKLQQPKRKNRMPFVITIAATAIACFFLAINFFPQFTQQHSITLETNDTSRGYPFTVLHKQNNTPIYMNDDYAMHTATSQQELIDRLKDYKIKAPTVDFNKHFVVIAQFPSDGCGLVVDQITTADNILQLKIALPVELRNNSEIACTSILQPNIEVLQLDKFPGYEQLQYGMFIHGSTENMISLNVMSIDELSYNFELLLDPMNIKKIVVNKIQASEQQILEDAETIQQLTDIVFHLQPIDGIDDMNTPQYQLIVQYKSDEELMLHIWFDEGQQKMVFMSERNKQQAYSVPTEHIESVLQLLK
ncbi:MAG: hypothetical protein ABS882_09060 [Lysinibacillus sp.]